MNKQEKSIVCLGGGIGTVNLVRGLKEYSSKITVVVSMADDGGSAGRLRRFYSVPPPGDLVSCIAALSNVDPLLQKLLTYRFAGNRYGSDRSLPGHKFGNLMLVALTSITGDFYKAVSEMQRLFQTSGKILPSTTESISIWAETSSGEKVYGEENIDLGKFTGKIERLHLTPDNPSVPAQVIKAIKNADIIVGGPGDLYTTILPVLLVPNIIAQIKKSDAKKVFAVNVANKIFETPDYTIGDFLQAIKKHCSDNVFDYFLVNNNLKPKMPDKFKRQYKYVLPNHFENDAVKLVKKDLIDESFPLYHSSEKLAKAVVKTI